MENDGYGWLGLAKRRYGCNILYSRYSHSTETVTANRRNVIHFCLWFGCKIIAYEDSKFVGE